MLPLGPPVLHDGIDPVVLGGLGGGTGSSQGTTVCVSCGSVVERRALWGHLMERHLK